MSPLKVKEEAINEMETFRALTSESNRRQKYHNLFWCVHSMISQIQNVLGLLCARLTYVCEGVIASLKYSLPPLPLVYASKYIFIGMYFPCCILS